MKRLSLLLLLAVIATACGMASPDAGHEQVLIQKPWIWGHGGVDPDAVKTGRTFVALSTQVVDVNMLPEQKKEHFEDLMSIDGVPLDFDGYLQVKVTDSVDLISRFGPQWYENNLQAEYRNLVRQAVRKRGMNETAINSTAIDAIDSEIEAGVRVFIKSVRLPVEVTDTAIGKANPPDAIKNQRVETAAQQQRIQTETQRKLAEDARKNAEEARAKADNAYKDALGMDTDQFIALEQVKMLREVCGKGCTVILGGGVVPTMNLKQ